MHSATDTASPDLADRNFLALALEAAGVVGIWDGDLINGRIYADESFARIYGVDAMDAAQGKPLGFYFQYIHPDDLASSNAAIERMNAGVDEYVNEHRVVRPDGTVRWVLARGRLARDSTGKPVRFQGVSIDLTERKLAENSQSFVLELSDELRKLADPERVLATATTRLGRYLGAARAGYGEIQADQATILVTCGYTNGAEAINGEFRIDEFGPGLAARAQAGLSLVEDDVLAKPELQSPTWRSIGTRAHVSVPLIRDGRYRALLYVTHTQPHHWTTTEVQLIEEVAERIWDALERARAERALRKANEELNALVAARTADRNRIWQLADEMMIICDESGRLLEANPTASRLLGVPEDELRGALLTDFLHPDDIDSTRAEIESLLAGRSSTAFENRYRTRSGEYRLISWMSVFDGGFLHGVGRDITAERAAEAKLRQSQKMDAVGQLTGGIAHDFNNMLQGVRGAMEVMSQRITQGRLDEAQRYISLVRQSIDRAATLTHRLLAFSRQQTLAPRAVEIGELVHAIGKLIQQTVGPMIDFQLRLIEGCGLVRCDPNQLENAILNLAINARDAMFPRGGTLCIETGHVSLTAADVAGWDSAIPGDFVRLSVRDTGVGMTPEVVRRAFEPFFTTKPDGQGTGLGLSQVYGFVSQSGGFMKIDSQVGVGTSIHIYLPHHHGDRLAIPDLVDPELPKDWGTRQATVLLVEDEDDIRTLTAQMLRERQHIVIEAREARSALAALQQRLANRAAIDILIADIGLPGGMTGTQLANSVREHLPDVPVLLITGYAGQALGPGLEVTENLSLLNKPFSFEALLARVDSLIAGAPPLDGRP